MALPPWILDLLPLRCCRGCGAPIERVPEVGRKRAALRGKSAPAPLSTCCAACADLRLYALAGSRLRVCIQCGEPVTKRQILAGTNALLIGNDETLDDERSLLGRYCTPCSRFISAEVSVSKVVGAVHIRSVFHHVDQARKLLHRLKFGRMWQCADLIGELFLLYLFPASAQLYPNEILSAEGGDRTSARDFGTTLHGLEIAPIDCIVAVPTTRTALARRGFAPTSVIAERLSVLTRLSLAPDALRVSGERTSQRGLSVQARMQNIRRAFVADAEGLRGRRVLLIDDVLTTGATIGEAILTLRRSGVARVDAVTFTRSTSFWKHREAFDRLFQSSCLHHATGTVFSRGDRAVNIRHGENVVCFKP